MAQVKLIMPKMGESIMEATILKWVKQVGDSVDVDETILEIATDKVDSEVPSPVSGVIAEILYPVDETVDIGKVIAVITTEGEEVSTESTPSVQEAPPVNGMNQDGVVEEKTTIKEIAPAVAVAEPAASLPKIGVSGRFYSPLVKNIAKKENIGIEELEAVSGTGKEGRVTKKDILAYISNRTAPLVQSAPQTVAPPISPSPSLNGNTEIVEMDRMRRLISEHMLMSKQTSAHVTSFVEVDVTNIVNWRNRIKDEYQSKHGQKITFTPIFIDAIVKAIRDFPMINVSVEGNNIIVKKDINIGMAAALPSGNLIVPVIKNADRLNLIGLTSQVNDFAARARSNKLKPEEIQGGTFTLTNVGTFGNVMGTPIINQPQVAILAAGAIRKKPAVVETEYGDLIAVRQLMFLSLAYDHRVVDGFLGGSFLRKVGDYLEAFDAQQTI